jgi:hypothetical protein
MITLRPRKSAWLPLLIIASPIIAVRVVALREGDLIGLGGIAPGAFLVGYNATISLTVTERQIIFKRYGFTVWSVPASGTTVENGRGGDLPVLPAYLFMRQSRQVGWVLRGWFHEADIAALRTTLKDGSPAQPGQVSSGCS